MEIKKPYSPYQEAHYRLTYSSNPSKRRKIVDWCVSYSGRVITHAMPYSGCVNEMKLLSRMGKEYPDKTLLKIIPYK